MEVNGQLLHAAFGVAARDVAVARRQSQEFLPGWLVIGGNDLRISRVYLPELPAPHLYLSSFRVIKHNVAVGYP